MVRDSMLQRAGDAQGREVRRRKGGRLESGHHSVCAAGGRTAIRRRRRKCYENEDTEGGAKIPGKLSIPGKGAMSVIAFETAHFEADFGGYLAESMVVGTCAAPARDFEAAAARALFDRFGEGSAASDARGWSGH